MSENDEAEVKALVDVLRPLFERVPLYIAADALGIVLAEHCVWRVFTGETEPEIKADMVERAREHIAYCAAHGGGAEDTCGARGQCRGCRPVHRRAAREITGGWWRAERSERHRQAELMSLAAFNSGADSDRDRAGVAALSPVWQHCALSDEVLESPQRFLKDLVCGSELEMIGGLIVGSHCDTANLRNLRSCLEANISCRRKEWLKSVRVVHKLHC